MKLLGSLILAGVVFAPSFARADIVSANAPGLVCNYVSPDGAGGTTSGRVFPQVSFDGRNVRLSFPEGIDLVTTSSDQEKQASVDCYGDLAINYNAKMKLRELAFVTESVNANDGQVDMNFYGLTSNNLGQKDSIGNENGNKSFFKVSSFTPMNFKKSEQTALCGPQLKINFPSKKDGQGNVLGGFTFFRIKKDLVEYFVSAKLTEIILTFDPC